MFVQQSVSFFNIFPRAVIDFFLIFNDLIHNLSQERGFHFQTFKFSIVRVFEVCAT